jgi:hypothetical protein
MLTLLTAQGTNGKAVAVTAVRGQGEQDLLMFAHAVIVAMGTAQAGRVQLIPSSRARDELTARSRFEASIVMNSVYPRHFWRETPFLADIPVLAGGTSLVASPVGEGLERYFDVSRTEEDSGCPGVLRTHMPKNEAAATVALRRFRMQDKLDSLIAWVGRTPPPDMFVEQAWNVSARYTLPNVMTTYGAAFREPVTVTL